MLRNNTLKGKAISIKELMEFLATCEFECDYNAEEERGVVYVRIEQEEDMEMGLRVCVEYRIEEGTPAWDAFWKVHRRRGGK